MTRIGVIGAGKAGELHAHAVVTGRRATLAWIADPDQARCQALAGKFGARHLTDHRVGLDDVDAVTIAVPHHLLADLAIDVLKAGKHVLLEKPMATSLVDARRVLDAARASRRVLMLGFVHRYRPDVQRARAIIADGVIGTPQFVIDRTIHGDLATWPGWVRRAETGGGLLLYGGVHRIDRARWFLGSDVVTVQGSAASQVPGYDVDSSTAALLVCANGTRAALTHHFHAFETPFAWDTDIHGTDGMIRIRTGESMDVTTRQGTVREVAGPDHKFEREIAVFVDAIGGARDGIPSGDDGVAVLAIALAILESSKAARAIRMDEFAAPRR